MFAKKTRVEFSEICFAKQQKINYHAASQENPHSNKQDNGDKYFASLSQTQIVLIFFSL
jgi:hypothetical protein